MTAILPDDSEDEALPWGEITDATIADAASIVGTVLRRDGMRWVNEASFDATQHFVEAVGDRNPIFRDLEYGRSTRWGSMQAHPSFLLAVDTGIIGPRMAGVTWIYAGVRWTWFDVLRVGDAFDAQSVFEGQRVMRPASPGRWVIQTGCVTYSRRPEDAVVAKAYTDIGRVPRVTVLPEDASEERRERYKRREQYVYAPEELEAIEDEILAMRPRGATPRFWEDVEVGEVLPRVVKGPLRSNDTVAWYAGTMGVRPYGGALEDAVHYRTRHKDYHVGASGVKDSPGRGHLEGQSGSDMGMGGAYDIGPQRVSWGMQAVTDWMGDDGFMHKFASTLRSSNLIGDTTYWTGSVTGKERVGDYCLVHIGLQAVNQRGPVLAYGTATVVLPSREGGPVVLPIPVDLVPDGTPEQPTES